MYVTYMLPYMWHIWHIYVACMWQNLWQYMWTCDKKIKIIHICNSMTCTLHIWTVYGTYVALYVGIREIRVLWETKEKTLAFALVNLGKCLII